MSLTQALSLAMSGLNATQNGLSIISGNVANANTPGYVRQTPNQVEVATGGNSGTGVDITGINRDLDTLLQGQLWTETSGGSYADTSAKLYQQLQQVYGTPGSSSSLSATYTNFTSAVQTLSTSPSSYSAQAGVLSAAQTMAQSLNSMTSTVQGLRTQAEQGITNDVQQANAAMQQIAKINLQLGSSATQDSTTAALEDQRDQAIGQLAQLMDIRVVQNPNNQISVFTGTGLQLVSNTASQLTFNNGGTLSATSLWNADPTKSGVGTVTLVSPGGTQTDLIANNVIQSGEIAAYVNMRDKVLPQAQNQLDAIANQMSQAVSNLTTSGTAVNFGSQNGYSVDVGSLQPGNSLQVTYTDGSNVQHTLTVVRVDDPSALPLPNTSTNPNNQTIGVNFSGGMASVVSQLNLALGSTLQFSNPSGTNLQVLNTAGSSVVVNSVSTTATMTSLASGNAQVPLFLDGTQPITGAITAGGSQSLGLAGRITVNGALQSNPSALVAYAAGVSSGDTTRPNYMLNQLTTGSLSFPTSTGIAGQNGPFSGTLTDFMSQVVSQQSLAANQATNLQQGQDTVVSALQQRFNNQSGVSIDTEMSNLIALQNAYAANARVMTTIQQMMNTLIQMGAA